MLILFRMSHGASFTIYCDERDSMSRYLNAYATPLFKYYNKIYLENTDLAKFTISLMVSRSPRLL